MGTVLTTITANDVDSSPALTYRFGNVTSAGPFSIDRYGGKVVLRKRLDAETRSEYTLQVIASDGIHEATTDLTVRVTDINDNVPRFEQSAYVAVLSGTYKGAQCSLSFSLLLFERNANREGKGGSAGSRRNLDRNFDDDWTRSSRWLSRSVRSNEQVIIL